MLRASMLDYLELDIVFFSLVRIVRTRARNLDAGKFYGLEI